MILILTHPGDPHGEAVLAEIERRGGRVEQFDTGDLPGRASLGLSIGPGGWHGTLEVPGRRVDLSQVSAVWNRRPKPPLLSDRMCPDDARLCQRECEHALASLWELLRERFWVGEPWVLFRARPKIPQLVLARELGFDIPDTLVTNRPEEVQAMHSRHGAAMVYKTMHTHSRQVAGRKMWIRTTRIGDRVQELAPRVRAAPCQFQSLVPKLLDVRVTIVGERLIAVAIDSMAREATRIDSRHAVQVLNHHWIHRLPQRVVEALLAMARRMGLNFGAADLVLTPDGRYVFLELNPNGQWLWLERLTGAPITAHLAEMLVQRRPDYRPPDTDTEHLFQAACFRGPVRAIVGKGVRP